MYTPDDLLPLKTIATDAISDALDTMSRKTLVLAPPVRLVAGRRIFGPALPIMVAATGEKAHHNAAMQTLDECEEGSVLVLAGDPDPIACAFGAPEIAIASARKLGGLLTDCPVRYGANLPDDVVGVGAAGLSPASGFGRLKTMTLSKSSNCAGVTIEAGDLIVGDYLGIIVVPAKYVKAVCEIAHLYQQRTELITRDAVNTLSIRDAVKTHWNI